MRDRREACALPRDVPVRGEIVEAELPDPAQGVLVRALGPRERLHGYAVRVKPPDGPADAVERRTERIGK